LQNALRWPQGVCGASRLAEKHLEANGITFRGAGKWLCAPSRLSFAGKGGCSFEQPPFTRFARFEQDGNKSVKKARESPPHRPHDRADVVRMRFA